MMTTVQAAIAVVKHPTKNLFLASEIKNKPGEYGFVGGKREKNEEPLDTAIRECLEESGLNLRAWAFQGKEIYSGPDSTGIAVMAYWFDLNRGKIPQIEFDEIIEKMIQSPEGGPLCKWATCSELCFGIYSEYNKLVFQAMEKFEVFHDKE